MNWQVISANPFFTVALPIVITLIVAMLSQNKRIDDLRDSINKRLDAIERRIDDLRDSVNKRFDAVDRRFDGVDRRFDGVDRRLDMIDAKLGQHAERIAKLEGPSLVRA